jgi:hypothetical protein
MARPLHPGRDGALNDLFYTSLRDVEIAEKHGMSRRMVHILAREWGIDMPKRTRLRVLLETKAALEDKLLIVEAQLEELKES